MAGRPPLTPEFRLTRMQIALALIAEGYSHEEIGARMGYSEPMVQVIIAEAKRSLGARNLAHAVALAARAGWVDLRPASHRNGASEWHGTISVAPRQPRP